jgi:hypothetical protein
MNICSDFSIPASGRHVTVSRTFLMYSENIRGKHSSTELRKTEEDLDVEAAA